jgi:hypothetical protein
MSLADVYAVNSYWINPVVGAVLSLSLFVITYRRTISATKERAAHAHIEVVRILIRNLLNLGRVLTISEINHVLQTKARENRIKVSDMPDEMSYVYSLQCRVAEDEMLSAEDRKDLFKKIQDFIDENEKANPQLTEEPKALEEQRTNIMSKYLAYVSLFAAISGIAASLILSFFSGTMIIENVMNTIGIIVSVIGVIVVLVTFLLFYEKSRPTLSVSLSPTTGQDFEDQIYKSLRKLGKIEKEPFIPEIRSRFDLMLSTKANKFLIETKSYRSYISTSTIAFLNDVASNVKKINKNYTLVLIVNDKKFLNRGSTTLLNSWDYVIDENDLPDFLSKVKFENERALRQR